MKFSLFFSLLFITTAFNIVNADQYIQEFDKAVFYDVMKIGNLTQINAELILLDAASIKEKDAYKGALLMRKAGLVRKAKDKLNFFKSGRIHFETALLSDPENVEYHFLRLTIQEHAPNVVKYRDQIENDRGFIQKNFKKLTPVVQQAVIEYSKTSKVLHPEDL